MHLSPALGASIIVASLTACGDPAPLTRPQPELRPTTVTQPAPSPWASEDACREALERNPPPTDRSFGRIGTWNVRYFPDGARPEGEGPETDVAWLACAVAHLDVDVLAVQELKRNGDGSEAAARLIEDLDALTGGDWKLSLDGCGGDALPHIGILHDASRVTVDGTRELDVVRATMDRPCGDEIRPGFTAHVAYPGGLSFEMVVVHLPSGETPTDRELRVAGLRGVEAALDELRATAPGSPVVVLGDFNTLGCPTCPTPFGTEAETALLEEAARGFADPLAVRSPACSEYRYGEPLLLDHVMLSSELESRVRGDVFVSGVCDERACRRSDDGTFAEAIAHLSDHCPVLLDLDLE